MTAIPKPLAQAAARAGIDERLFRTLVDKRIVFATPETRAYGRTKPKMYDASQITIASICGSIVAKGVSTFVVAEIAEWLQGHCKGEWFEAARRGEPIYVRLSYDGSSGSWACDFARARPIGAGKELFVTVAKPNSTDTLSRALGLELLYLPQNIGRAEFDFFTMFRSRPPSSVRDDLDREPELEREILAIHPKTELVEFKEELEAAIAAGNRWPDAEGGGNE